MSMKKSLKSTFSAILSAGVLITTVVPVSANSSTAPYFKCVTPTGATGQDITTCQGNAAD